LGTAAGDLSAEKLDLGYAVSILIFGGLIAAVISGHYAFGLNAVLSGCILALVAFLSITRKDATETRRAPLPRAPERSGAPSLARSGALRCMLGRSVLRVPWSTKRATFATVFGDAPGGSARLT
jgi:hypothetical protein